ncbi:hypothetical protein FSZ06_05660 [Enterococcus gallinarum]|nr:hypothetical protein FSZ06_05660 [Enterococcus gallinarum]
MNVISQYEQWYISYSEFLEEFPDSISESQECLYGTKCVEHYVKLTLGKTDFNYYIQKYGGDHCEIIERCSFEDTSVENVEDPFGPFLS